MWKYVHAHLNTTAQNGIRSRQRVTELDRQITLNLIIKVGNLKTKAIHFEYLFFAVKFYASDECDSDHLSPKFLICKQFSSQLCGPQIIGFSELLECDASINLLQISVAINIFACIIIFLYVCEQANRAQSSPYMQQILLVVNNRQ